MIPQITLSGTPREMGSAFGEAFREKIHEMAQSRFVRLKQYIVTPQVILRSAFCDEGSPDNCAEICFEKAVDYVQIAHG